MKKHITYSERSGRENPDFVIKYKFYDFKNPLPKQGYRSSFMYEADEEKKQAYEIVPEFKDKNKKVIIDLSERVSREGEADMWIVVEESRGFHSNMIKRGVRGFLLEGSIIVADCEVLKSNL